MNIPQTLLKRLEDREKQGSLRELSHQRFATDFWSNDYLGLSQSTQMQQRAYQILQENEFGNGATGSRLISGNFPLYTACESFVSAFHNAPDCLIFNSGYDANLGIFSCIPQRNDVILYDQYIHASIRDGMSLGSAKSFKFKHNDCDDLERWLKKVQGQYQHIYIVTESVFSMDGDSPNLPQMVALCHKYNAYLIVDEAHAIGVFGEKGEGLVQELGLQDEVFIRLITFSKGLGSHGAAVLSSPPVTAYLINFARSFIYTTGLSPINVAYILAGYQALEQKQNIQQLHQNIALFRQKVEQYRWKQHFIDSHSPIQAFLWCGNQSVIKAANFLQEQGIGIKPILSPTVSKGQERLRICLHSFNTKSQIEQLFELLREILS